MKMITFANRTAKEILRDPLTLAFGLGFPIVLILLLSAIQANIPVELFEIQSLTPGISALLQRLYTTPLSAADFVLGYALPILPIAIAQSMVCYIAAIILGLDVTVNIIYALIFLIPVALLFIALGLMFGSILTTKQVGGICGALLTNLTAWLSGVWFDLNLVGGVFKNIAYALPFVHAVELERAVLGGDFTDIYPHIIWVLGYTFVISALAVLLFLRQMKKQ